MAERVEVPWEESEGAETFGAQLQRLASGLGEVFRKLHAGGDLRRAERGALLDGAVQSLTFEIGRALDDARHEPPGAPWSRAQGLLRLSAARGEAALDEEFALLAELLDGLALRTGADAPTRRAVRLYLDAAHNLAVAELRHLTSGGPVPRHRFGGVVLEVFEERRLH